MRKVLDKKRSLLVNKKQGMSNKGLRICTAVVYLYRNGYIEYSPYCLDEDEAEWIGQMWGQADPDKNRSVVQQLKVPYKLETSLYTWLAKCKLGKKVVHKFWTANFQDAQLVKNLWEGKITNGGSVIKRKSPVRALTATVIHTVYRMAV